MGQSKGIIAKISHPRPASVYNRKRLIKLIDKYRKYPIIWISGAPGAGKTTLAASYLEHCKAPCIWYQIDGTDDDPANIFHYMSLAASEASKGKTKPLPKLSPENLLNLQNYAVQYFRELFDQLKKPSVVVFDNYQELPIDSVIHDLINAGLEQIPYGINVIVLSRTPPPAEMARLMVNKALMVIEPEALLLTDEESMGIAALADKWKCDLESVAKFLTYTDGWAAGLVLMLEYANPGDETPSQSMEMAKELFFNYFAGEIFNKMEPAVQDFIQKIACMPSFTPEAATKITGFTEAGKILADMNRANYFTEKKVHNSTSYQFHPLFRAFLLSKIKKSLAPERLTELYQNAADTLVEVGQLEDAFNLYAMSKKVTAQVNLIRNHAAAFMEQGRMRIVEHWINQLPQAIFRSDPRLLYIYAQCRMPFDIIESRNTFIQAYHLLKNEDDTSDLILTICGVVETITTEWGDFRQLDSWIEELGHLLKDQKSLLSPEIDSRAVFALFSALMFRQPQHADMKIMEKRLFELLQSDAEPQLRVMAGTYLSHYHSWTGDIFKTRFITTMVRDLMKHATLPPLVFMAATMSEAVYEWFRSDLEGCLEAVNKGIEEADKSGVHIIDHWLMAQEVYARLTLDGPESEKPILDKMKPIIDSNRYLDISQNHHLRSLSYLKAGDRDLALQHSKEALRLAEKAGTPFPEGLNCITSAQIYFDLGDEKTAQKLNTRAMDIGCRMQSHLLKMLSLFNQSYFSLKNGNADQAKEPLEAALKIRKKWGLINFSCWRKAFMQDLYEEALRTGTEVEYVQNLIRIKKLRPKNSSEKIENWPWQVRIYTLGRFDVVLDEEPLVFKGKPKLKPLEMLKALIALGGKNVGLSRLEDLLYPDADGDRARKASITTLHRLRKLIGYEKAVILSESRMSLNDRYCWLDVWAIENLCNQKDEITAKIGPDANGTGRLADKLLRLYGGDFLKDEGDLSWAVPLRIKLRGKFLRALSQLALGLQDQGEHEKAIDLYLRGLEADEIAEELYQGLMMCYQSLGRTTESLSTYERCRDVLSSILGCTPSPKTESIRMTLERQKNRLKPQQNRPSR